MAEIYDMVIIGGGAAGFTAGIYAARDRCQALLLERVAAGGQVLNCEHDVPFAIQTRLNFDVILPLWGRRGPR
jgi:thioredoxin reductase